MQEQGKIIRIIGDEAVVELEQGEQCKNCNACRMFGDSTMQLTARNEVRARIGDRVVVHVNPQFILKSVFWIFIFPVLAMIAGYGLGQFLLHGSGESGGIVGAFSGLFLALLGNRIQNSLIAPGDRNRARIISQVQGAETEKTGRIL